MRCDCLPNLSSFRRLRQARRRGAHRSRRPPAGPAGCRRSHLHHLFTRMLRVKYRLAARPHRVWVPASTAICRPRVRRTPVSAVRTTARGLHLVEGRTNSPAFSAPTTRPGGTPPEHANPLGTGEPWDAFGTAGSPGRVGTGEALIPEVGAGRLTVLRHDQQGCVTHRAAVAAGIAARCDGRASSDVTWALRPPRERLHPEAAHRGCGRPAGPELRPCRNARYRTHPTRRLRTAMRLPGYTHRCPRGSSC